MVVLAMDTFSKRGRNNVGVRNASPPCRSQTGTFGVVEPQRTMSGTQRKIRRAGTSVPPAYTLIKKKTVGTATPPTSPLKCLEPKGRSKSCVTVGERGDGIKIKKTVSFTSPQPAPPPLAAPPASPAKVNSAETSHSNPFKTSCVYMCEGGGSVLLSVCPGKKMKQGRNGKSYARCLKHDLTSVKERSDLSTVVCLLNNAELRTLGVKPEQYGEFCNAMQIKYLQYPMIEMAAPADCAAFDEDVLRAVIGEVKEGKSVLVHCRGGVGRAGLLAACMILRVGEVRTADEAIATIRKRRDLRAVESLIQVNFVRKYAGWLASAKGLENLELTGTMPLSARQISGTQQPGVQVSAARRLPLNTYNNSTGNIISSDRSVSQSLASPNKLYRRSASNCFQSKSFPTPSNPADDRTTRRSLSQCVATVTRNSTAPPTPPIAAI